MTAVAGGTGLWSTRPAGSLARLLYRRPEWGVLAAAAVGWVVMVPIVWGGQGSGHHRGAPVAPLALAGQSLLTFLIMTAAMMLPTTVPAVRYIAFASSRRRRQRSVAWFCAGYVASWLPLGLALAVAHAALPAIGVPGMALAIALTAGWELTPVKRRALRRCHRTYPVRFRGWAADRSAASFGWRHGLTCVVAGGPMMAALMLLGHPVVLTLLVAGVMLAQQALVRPERWTGLVALTGLIGAVLVLGLA
jgi:predicted metal-binding membrane protein